LDWTCGDVLRPGEGERHVRRKKTAIAQAITASVGTSVIYQGGPNTPW